MPRGACFAPLGPKSIPYTCRNLDLLGLDLRVSFQAWGLFFKDAWDCNDARLALLMILN